MYFAITLKKPLFGDNKKSTSEVISISGLKQFKFQPLKCQFMKTSTHSPRARLWQYWELIKIPFGGQIYFHIRICWYISRANIDKRRGGFFPLSDIFSHRRLKILALNCEEALKPRRLGLKGWVVINLWICDTSWGSKTFFFWQNNENWKNCCSAVRSEPQVLLKLWKP